MKLCKDCAHYSMTASGHTCNAVASLVTGEVLKLDCEEVRYKGDCGREGKLFVAREAA